jgi:hypothetical protein
VFITAGILQKGDSTQNSYFRAEGKTDFPRTLSLYVKLTV